MAPTVVCLFVCLFVDILSAVSDLTELEFEFHVLPVAKGLQEFNLGRIDLEPGVHPIWRTYQSVHGVYSIPYAKSTEVIVFAPGQKKTVTHPSHLAGEIIGTTRGFSYPDFDSAFSSGMITRLDNLSQSLIIEQLFAGRFQQIFVGRSTILYFQKIRPEMQVLVIGNVVEEKEVMMRVHPSKEHVLESLNAALKTLLSRGEIKNIYDKYR